MNRFSSPFSKRRKRVLILSWRDPWHPEGGGSEHWLQEVAERVAEDHEVIVLTAGYPGGETQRVHNNVRYVRHGRATTVFAHGAFALATRRFGRIDSVLEVQNGMPFLARLFTRAPVTVLVHHVHREQWNVAGPVLSKIGWFLESRVAPRINRGLGYLAVSEVTRDELASLGVNPAKVALAWNGTDTVPELDNHEDATDTPALVVLSRLVPHKQIEHAIRVTAALLPEFPDLNLRIVGSGWWEDHLRAEIDRLGLSEHVEMVGHVDERTKYAELSRGWVHLLPSVKEGWGLSIIEAAQVGRPSIAYHSAGGVRDSIIDGTTGFLADDEAHMVALTGQLLRDSELRHAMGDKARARAEEFTWDTTASTVRQQMNLDDPSSA